MRFLTAGESHGEAVIAILEGFPKGVKIEESLINRELRRRKAGYGRGPRMGVEEDKAHIVSGLRNKITLGSPICVLVRNRDQTIFPQKEDNLEPITVPRPAHADLGGGLKYREKDLRNILERASARETVARVCIGSICKQFLLKFNIKIASFVVGIGKIISSRRPKSIEEIVRKSSHSSLNCIDPEGEKLMIEEIDKAQEEGDTLGGVAEVWADNVPIGLGGFMHLDKRLDARIANLVISIPGVKGIEFGLGFKYAENRGSESHDAIYFSSKKGFWRKTNNAGGIEGGMSNGEPIVVRFAMKPISTLRRPLDSIDLRYKRKSKAPVIRSDVCAVSASGVIAENMIAIALVECFLEKFGCDSFKEIQRNYRNYIKSLSF